jgi:hypothetical protein
MAKNQREHPGKHRFENTIPQQERFPQERGGVETMSNSRPITDNKNFGLQNNTGDGDEGLSVPQRRHAYGEFMTESHTKGSKKDEE